MTYTLPESFLLRRQRQFSVLVMWTSVNVVRGTCQSSLQTLCSVVLGTLNGRVAGCLRFAVIHQMAQLYIVMECQCCCNDDYQPPDNICHGHRQEGLRCIPPPKPPKNKLKFILSRMINAGGCIDYLLCMCRWGIYLGSCRMQQCAHIPCELVYATTH